MGDTTVTTDPVGYMTVTIAPGMQTLGIPMLRTSVFAGGVQSNTASVITLSGTTNIGALLTSGTPYYLEVTTGTADTYVGERFDVDVATTIASATNTVSISATSTNNTISGGMPDLTGYNFVIRPHHTIGSVFGTQGNTQMQGAKNIPAADQIYFLNPVTQGYDSYFLYQNINNTVQEWRQMGTGAASNNRPIPSGVGMFVIRNGSTAVTLTIQGDVRTSNYHVQPLKAGWNLISEGYPVNRSPGGTGLDGKDMIGTEWTGAKRVAASDQFYIWSGTGYDTYFLYQSGTSQQWRKMADKTTPPTNFTPVDVIPLDKAVFINRVTSFPDYAEKKPF